MEQNLNDGLPLVFDVICMDDDIIKDCVAFHNQRCNTDFEIVGFSYEEVVFATIRVSKYQTSDIFRLGYLLGGGEERWRHKHGVG
jgi:hypothetical protein